MDVCLAQNREPRPIQYLQRLLTLAGAEGDRGSRPVGSVHVKHEQEVLIVLGDEDFLDALQHLTNRAVYPVVAEVD